MEAQLNNIVASLQNIAALLDKLVWFIGSMESHSEMRLLLEAKHRGVPCVWWDPSVEPPEFPPHGENRALTQIKFYLPPHLRKVKP